MKMEDIYATRLERFRQIMAEQYGGKQAAIASAVGKPANYVSRVLNGTKKLGEEMAREFEESLNKPPYWLDGRETSGGWPFPSVERTRYESLTIEQQKGIEQWVGRQVDAYSQEAPPKSSLKGQAA